ncbi:hypothetical protein ERJ75_001458500 [Trypanosoma vivax]|nr:hypothetical protein TRVL_07103 [Trypanosoma vivax]KAH8607056.1 hypothetical protein ERJ75_001458500 [Trypanosoma vivax]
MLNITAVRLSRRFRYNTKYPALVSYNKLPWELLNHETPQFHMHVAPHYEQIFTLAALTQVPHMVVHRHVEVPAEHRLRLLPGMLYLMDGDNIPQGFTPSRVLDPTALQYYGGLHAKVAQVTGVRMLLSEDLRLICNAVTLRGPTRLPVAPHGALALLRNATASSESGGGGCGDDAMEKDRLFTLYHYARPNRPPSELQLDKFYIHAPVTIGLDEFTSSRNKTGNVWEPRLQAPKRTRGVTPLPAYRPPQSYLMGLAERLAVVPGSCFGRRSLMWGHWF